MTSSSTTTDQSPASKDLEIAEELENSFPVPPIQPIQIPNRLVQKEEGVHPQYQRQETLFVLLISLKILSFGHPLFTMCSNIA